MTLCLDAFCWAKFRKEKGAIKIHTLYNVKISIPVFIHINKGNVHDVNALNVLTYEADRLYITDKAYVDFKQLFTINKPKAFYVRRAKKKLILSESVL